MTIQPIDITQIIVAIIAASGTVISAWITYRTSKLRQEKKEQKKQLEKIGEEASRIREDIRTATRRINIFIIIICIGLILLIGNFLFFLARPITEVGITYPHNGDTVEIREMVRGTSQNIPKGQVIYIVVYPYIVGRYYPQDNPVDIQENGEWITPAFIGVEEDVGGRFDIIAVLVDERAQDAFNIYFTQQTWGGFERLPKGALIYYRVTVTRE